MLVVASRVHWIGRSENVNGRHYCYSLQAWGVGVLKQLQITFAYIVVNIIILDTTKE